MGKESKQLNLDLKYRIKDVEGMLGNKKTMTFVDNLLRDGNFPNTTIISGPSGSGKTTLAYIIAKTLKCETSKGKYICGECKSCLAVEESLYETGEGRSALGVYTFDMGLNSDVEYINDLAKSIQSGSLRGNKVMIIEELQRTRKENQEALLRVLEYSTEDTYVIITTTDLYKIQKAIQTRSTLFRMAYPEERELINFSKEVAKNENIRITATELRDLVRYQNNNPRLVLKGLQNIKASGKAGIDYLITLQQEENQKYIEYFDAVEGGLMELIPFIEQLEEPAKFMHGIKFFLKEALTMKYLGRGGKKKYRDSVMNILNSFKDREIIELMDYLSNIGKITDAESEVILFTVSYKLNELLYYQAIEKDPIQNVKVEEEFEIKKLDASKLKQRLGSINIDEL